LFDTTLASAKLIGNSLINNVKKVCKRNKDKSNEEDEEEKDGNPQLAQ
jgi:hypothetical protein